jgi:hypothetical protein
MNKIVHKEPTIPRNDSPPSRALNKNAATTIPRLVHTM